MNQLKKVNAIKTNDISILVIKADYNSFCFNFPAINCLNLKENT